MKLRRASIAVLVAALGLAALPAAVGVAAATEDNGTAVPANSLLPLAIPATLTTCDEQGNPVSTGEPWPLGVVVTVPFCANALPFAGQPWTAWGGSSSADLRNAIENPNNPAYILPADVPAVIPNGFMSALAAAVNEYQGLVIRLPMSDAFVDGTDPVYHVVGVASLELERALLTQASWSDCGPADATYGCLVGIFKAPLTVTALGATRLLGASTPAFSVDYSGFVDGDSPSVLGGSLAVAPTTAVDPTVPGVYVLRASGLTSAKYAITFVDGSLTTKYAICLLYDPTKPVAGSSVPIKFSLCNAEGANLSTSGIAISAIEIVRNGTMVASASGPITFNKKLGAGGGYQYSVSSKDLIKGQRVAYELKFRVSTDAPGVYQFASFIVK